MAKANGQSRWRAVVEINGQEHSSVRTNERDMMSAASLLVQNTLGEWRNAQNYVEDPQEFTVRFIPDSGEGA